MRGIGRRAAALMTAGALLMTAGCAGQTVDYENLSQRTVTAGPAETELGQDANADGITLKTALQIACTYVGCEADGVSFIYMGAETVDGKSCEIYTVNHAAGSFSMALYAPAGAVYVDRGDGYTRVKASNEHTTDEQTQQ